ncbi:M23 family metallopeptidase [uncultured Phenylobacterium sp.]|uniref:M23 family metallopeptidase n=1 Tax=uncultured Phenylobacterium sp. TaxID=349273 RepID=UPI0025DDB5AE|nr:M23 family metallopeptidase [uncultured Phenylobacterium sp.]
MFPDVRLRLRELVADRLLQVLTLLAAVTATAAAAAPLTGLEGRARISTAVERAVATVAPPAPAPEPEPTLVWEGADVDGDGRADFANPTGQHTRGHDAYGEGEFGARRDGGSRRHEGVDFKADAGQTVEAPISGYVTKIGYAYAGDETLKFVEITNPALRYAARVFYVTPKVQVGETVALGHPIGAARSLQRKYPRGMTNHVHLEILDQRGRHVDATEVITAQYRVITTAAAD